MCCCTYLVDIFKSRIAALYPTAVLKSLHRLPAPVPAVGKVLLNVLVTKIYEQRVNGLRLL